MEVLSREFSEILDNHLLLFFLEDRKVSPTTAIFVIARNEDRPRLRAARGEKNIFLEEPVPRSRLTGFIFNRSRKSNNKSFGAQHAYLPLSGVCFRAHKFEYYIFPLFLSLSLFFSSLYDAL